MQSVKTATITDLFRRLTADEKHALCSSTDIHLNCTVKLRDNHRDEYVLEILRPPGIWGTVRLDIRPPADEAKQYLTEQAQLLRERLGDAFTGTITGHYCKGNRILHAYFGALLQAAPAR